MNGLFDSLKGKLDESPQGGISPVQIASLPPVERKIIRLLLRELELTHAAILEALRSLPEGERPTHDEAESALNNLAKESWVIRMGDGEGRRYEPNLRRKPPSTLGKAVWSRLDSLIDESKSARAEKKQ